MEATDQAFGGRTFVRLAIAVQVVAETSSMTTTCTRTTQVVAQTSSMTTTCSLLHITTQVVAVARFKMSDISGKDNEELCKMVEGKSHVARVIAAATLISRIYKEVCPDNSKEEDWAWMRGKDNQDQIEAKFNLAQWQKGESC